MSEYIELTIDELLLDSENPRIGETESQNEALQKIIEEQGAKLANLAADIIDAGLNPIELMFVIADGDSYVTAEGNRRLAVLKLLNNANLIRRMAMPQAVQNKFLALADKFDRSKVEPIFCCEAESRDEARRWIKLRHTGQNEGVGVVPWETLARERFAGDKRTGDVFEFVMRNAAFTGDQARRIANNLSGSTLGRFVQSSKIRPLLGIEVDKGVMHAKVDPREVIKPLQRLVLDIAEGRVDSRSHNTVDEMTTYLKRFPKSHRANLSKKIAPKALAEITIEKKRRSASTKVKVRPPTKVANPRARTTVAPRKLPFKVSNRKAGAILYELSQLSADETPFAGGVLIRVFLELSVDYYCGKHRIPTSGIVNGHKKDHSLQKKIDEVVAHLEAHGVPKKDLNPVNRARAHKNRVFSVERLHDFVHHSFATPSPSELTALWDETERFFEHIWQ